MTHPFPVSLCEIEAMGSSAWFRTSHKAPSSRLGLFEGGPFRPVWKANFEPYAENYAHNLTRAEGTGFLPKILHPRKKLNHKQQVAQNVPTTRIGNDERYANLCESKSLKSLKLSWVAPAIPECPLRMHVTSKQHAAIVHREVPFNYLCQHKLHGPVFSKHTC